MIYLYNGLSLFLLNILFGEIIQFPNAFGFIALLFFLIGLIPTNLRKIFPTFKKTRVHKFLVQGRRDIGLASFFLSICHAYLIIKQGNFEFSDLETFSNFSSGIILITLFLILAITSTQQSKKNLGIGNWRRLHHWLSYTGLFVLAWHILDKMRNHYSIYTLSGLILIAIIAGVYALRKDIEFNFFSPIEIKSTK